MPDYGNSVKERIETFERLHGRAAWDGYWFYYRDGANRDGNPLGPLCEPPADARARYHNIVRYYQIRLDQKVREFDNTKKIIQENPGSHPDEETNLRRLRRLRSQAKRLRARLWEAQEELHRHSPGYRDDDEEEEEYIRQTAARHAARSRYEAALDAIQI